LLGNSFYFFTKKDLTFEKPKYYIYIVATKAVRSQRKHFAGVGAGSGSKKQRSTTHYGE
jgi:hypothetical protein